MIADKLRSCDKYGASVSLNYKRKAQHNTLIGGVTSVALQVLILIYFTVKCLEVANYKDPEIVSYQIMEDRTEMTEFLNAADYRLDLQVDFKRRDNYKSVILD